MDQQTAKTIDEYRDACRQEWEFNETYGLNPSNAHANIASTVLESLAVTGSPDLFNEVEEVVRRLVLRVLRHYQRTGKRELIYFRSGRRQDGRQEARAAIVTLAAADLIPQSMMRIAVPPPVFMGLEHIEDIGPLYDRLLCDDALLDVNLVALAQEVSDPRGYHQCLRMSLLITEYERRSIDETLYERVAVRSCIAEFSMYKNVGMYFWPRFSLGFVNRLRVIQEARPRGQTALVIKLDMGEKGRLWCREMKLLRLDEIKCDDEASASQS